MEISRDKRPESDLPDTLKLKLCHSIGIICNSAFNSKLFLLKKKKVRLYLAANLRLDTVVLHYVTRVLPDEVSIFLSL